MYIAVFCKNKEWEEMGLLPKSSFIRITSTDDIRGRTFDDIIKCYHWWDNEKIIEAYKLLRRDPILFITNK